MGSRIRLEWRGDGVFKAVLDATKRAMDSVLADCVVQAKQDVPRKTSILQGSIQMRPAHEERPHYPVGYFGSWSVKYAAAVEFGTAPHLITARGKTLAVKPPPPGWGGPVSKQGYAIFGKRVRHPGTKPRPYLIPAATKFFPLLPGRIRQELENG